MTFMNYFLLQNNYFIIRSFPRMHITYGFVFYFSLTMIALTFSLIVFTIRPIRRLVFNFSKKSGFGDNSILQYTIYISFAIIGLILIDSIWSYVSLKHKLNPNQNMLLGKDFSMLQTGGDSKNVISLFKQQREFYMAERNFMLTVSAIIAYFMFTRFVVAIHKLNDIENQIQKTQAQAKKTK